MHQTSLQTFKTAINILLSLWLPCLLLCDLLSIFTKKSFENHESHLTQPLITEVNIEGSS